MSNTLQEHFFIYHPSFDDFLLNLTNEGHGDVAIKILGIMCKLDFEDLECFLENPYKRRYRDESSDLRCNTVSKYFDICIVRSLENAFFKDIIFRIRIKPKVIGDVLTYCRIVFFRDCFLDQNIYLYINKRNHIDYDSESFINLIFSRYNEYIRKLREEYKRGITPQWRI